MINRGCKRHIIGRIDKCVVELEDRRLKNTHNVVHLCYFYINIRPDILTRHAILFRFFSTPVPGVIKKQINLACV